MQIKRSKSLGDRLAKASIVNPYHQHHLLATLQLGQFTEQDIEDAFNRIDTNHDGRISAEELKQLFRNWADTKGLGDDEVDQMVTKFMTSWDDDQSGDLDKDEFKRHAVALGEQIHPFVYPIAASFFIMVIPFGIVAPFEPQLVNVLGITVAQFGAANAAMAITKFLVNIPVTDFVDKIGAKPALMGSTVVLGAGVAGMSLVTGMDLGINGLMASRAIGGLGMAGLMASATAMFLPLMSPLNRARTLAPIQQAANAGFAAGPAIGGVLAGVLTMEQTFATVGGMLALSSVAQYLMLTETAPAKTNTSKNPLELFTKAFGSWYTVLITIPETRVILAASATLQGSLAGTNMTVMPLLLSAEPLNFTASLIGTLMTGLAISNIVLTQPLAVFADKFGRRTSIGVGGIVLAGSLAATPLCGTPAIVSSAIMTAGVGNNLLLSMGLAPALTDAVMRKDPKLLTQAQSLNRSVGDIGTMSGAVSIGILGTQFGFMPAYEACSGAVLFMAIAAFLRIKDNQVAKVR